MPATICLSSAVGKYLISVLNSDYDWYVFFRMLFAIEPGNNIHDFTHVSQRHQELSGG